MSSRPIAVDLFAGAGGATQGLFDAGFDVRAAVELEEDAAASFRANHPQVALAVGDVREVTGEQLLGDANVARGELSLLKTCPPCQGFSSLGKRSDGDARNELVTETMRFVRALAPKALVLENVRGLKDDKRFKKLISALNNEDYGTATKVIDAQEVGVPQRRERLMLIAIRDLASSDLDVDWLDLLPESFQTTTASAAEVIARAGDISNDGDPVHKARTPRPQTLERIRAVPTDGSRFDLPEAHQLDCHKRLETRSATSSYGRIPTNGVAPTLTTRCTTPSCGSFIHPTEHRGISLREAALLQTFPLEYKFVGGYDSVERQIGNAVPTKLARAVALIVLRFLDEVG